jgi:hypothetical protein
LKGIKLMVTDKDEDIFFDDVEGIGDAKVGGAVAAAGVGAEGCIGWHAKVAAWAPGWGLCIGGGRGLCD